MSNAAEAFYRHLPVADMICEVSLFLGEVVHCGLYRISRALALS